MSSYYHEFHAAQRHVTIWVYADNLAELGNRVSGVLFERAHRTQSSEYGIINLRCVSTYASTHMTIQRYASHKLLV